MPHQRVRLTSAQQSGFDEAMREPREYEAPLCAQVGGDYWFPESNNGDTDPDYNVHYAKKVCQRCIHRIECAEWGIQNERFGIWGGLSESRRRELRRQRNVILKEEKSA